jgi:uncharacterized protein YdcH (DUF465 family)
MFPAKTEMAFCVYFSLAQFLVTDENPDSAHLFRDYADRVVTTKGDIESKMATTWKAEFKAVVLNNFQYYKDKYDSNEHVKKLNKKLTSHCCRKYTMNELANMFSVMPHMITFRVGMLMKNIHTFFEYVVASEKMDINTAKNIAGWDDVLDQHVFGGYPPNCDDITAEKDKLCTFIDHLFVHQEQLDEDVKYVLTASILRFYQEYCILVSNEPDGKFKNICNNRFVLAVENARRMAEVDESTFTEWQNEVNSGFVGRNEFSLDGEIQGSDEVRVKPFIKVVTDQAKKIDKMEAQFKQLADSHNKLQKNYDELEKTHSTLVTSVQDLHSDLQSQYQNTNRMMGMILQMHKETHAACVSMASRGDNSHSSLTFDNSDLSNIVIQANSADDSEVTFSQSTTDSVSASQTSAPNLSDVSPILNFMTIHDNYISKASIAKVFYNYYVLNVEASYEMWRQNVDKPTRATIYNKMNNIRQVVLHMCMFNKRTPEDKPTDAAEEGAWQIKLHRVAFETEKSIVNFFKTRNIVMNRKTKKT